MGDEDLTEEPRERVETIFINKIMQDIDYFGREWNMTYAQIVGCLRCIEHELLNEAFSYFED